MEHFRIELDPISATTSFTWTDRGPGSTLDNVNQLIVDRIESGHLALERVHP